MTGRERQLDLLDRLSARDAAGGLAELSAEGDVEGELTTVIDLIAEVVMSDVPRAMAGGRAVVRVADLFGNPLLQVRARRATSRAMAWGSAYAAALSLADDAVDIAEQAGLQEESGRARLASMHALTELGRLDDAAAAGKAARAVFEGLGLPDMAARADINLGVVYQHLDRPADAVAVLKRAREPLAEEPSVLGHLENNLGESLLALDDIVGAESAFRSARSAFEAAGANLTAAISEGNLADLAARQGRLGMALRWFEQARRRLVPIDAPGHLARLLAERAEVLAAVGVPTSACEAFEEVLPKLEEAGLAVEAARARRGLGRAAMATGDLSRASTMLSAAATAYADLGQSTARAEIDLDRARIAARRHQIEEACRLTHAAMSQLRGRPLREIECRLVLADAFLEGDPPQAECELDAAELLARRFDVPPLLARTLHLRGQLRRRQGRHALASAALSEATSQVERLRGTVQADRCRAGLGLTHRGIYEDHLAALIEAADGSSIERAFGVADRMRSRILLDQVRRLDVCGDGDDQELDTEVERLRAHLSLLYSRLADAMDGAELDVPLWQTDLRNAEARLREAELRLASSGMNVPEETSALLADDVRSQLAPGEVVVQYAVLNGEVMAFVVHEGGLEFVRGLGTIDRIAERLEALRFQIARAVGHRGTSHRRLGRMVEETRGQLAGLSDQLYERLPRLVRGAERLTMAPQGLLHLVPFHALHDGDVWLAERHVTQYIPSVSLLLHLRHRSRSRAEGAPVVVAGSAGGLPGIRREAERVVDMLGPGTTLLAGEAASVEAVRAAVADARIVHIAGHGRFMPTHVGASGIRLDDRWLSLHEIHDLKLRAELVVLSACESGPLRCGREDEPTGLFHGFLASGASGLLATLWRVSDATALFTLDSFHDQMHNHEGDFASALRATHLAAMDETPHPAHWAPFIFAGVNP